MSKPTPSPSSSPSHLGEPMEEIFPPQSPEILLSLSVGRRRALQGPDLSIRDWSDLVRDSRLEDARVEGADLPDADTEETAETLPEDLSTAEEPTAPCALCHKAGAPLQEVREGWATGQRWCASCVEWEEQRINAGMERLAIRYPTLKAGPIRKDHPADEKSFSEIVNDEDLP